jgi:acetylglutamate kinase
MNYEHTQHDTVVIKVGGNEIDDDGFLAGLVAAVAEVQKHARVAIVHGGGKEIGELHGQLGIAFEFVEGLRVTSADSLRLVKMVLSGQVNTRLTRWLVNGGIDALGMSGVDLGLVRVEPLRPNGLDIGFVGRVVGVRAEPLQLLLANGIVPVISPISLGVDGLSYNVNADQVAAALAVALGAGQLIFVSNVPGVLIDDTLAPKLSIANVEAHIASGQISGGMVPKVRSAIEAVQAGVPAAVITNLDGLLHGRGTVIRGRQTADG